MANDKKVRGVFERKPGSGIWWVSYLDVEGRRHREKVGRKSDAISLLEKRRGERRVAKKMPENIRRRVVRFDELLADAKEYSRMNHTPRSGSELALKTKIISAAFSGRDATSITRQEIARWLDATGRQRKWSNATVNRYQSVLSLIFRLAAENEKVERNPASRIRRKVENTRVRFLTAPEEEKLRAVISKRCPHNLPAFTLSLNTGMRAGEQFGLKWDQIDFERKMITLPKTKNGKIRHIRLNSAAFSALVQLQQQNTDSEFVHLNRRGDKLRCHRDWYEPVVEEAKLKGVTWHVNRHTFASRLVMLGVDLRTVGELLGHSSFAMTMRYAHLAPEHMAEAVERLCENSQKESGTSSGTSHFQAPNRGQGAVQ